VIDSIILDDTSLALNLVQAIKYAYNRPFSGGLLKRINGIITTSEVVVSEFRKNQSVSPNDIFWAKGSNPVPQDIINSAIFDMENDIRNIDYRTALFVAAKIQYQLEILNPFSKYSRMTARVIAMLFLKWSGLLSHPVLWLSDYLSDFKIEYKDRIFETYKRSEDMLNALWTKFFLSAINTSAKRAIYLIDLLENTRQAHIALVPKICDGNKSALIIYEYVSRSVIINVRQVADEYGLSFSGVSKVIKSFESAGIVRQVTQKERYRQFGYAPVLDWWDKTHE